MLAAMLRGYKDMRCARLMSCSEASDVIILGKCIVQEDLAVLVP